MTNTLNLVVANAVFFIGLGPVKTWLNWRDEFPKWKRRLLTWRARRLVRR